MFGRTCGPEPEGEGMDVMVSLRVAPGPAPRTVSLAGELDAASAREAADRVVLHLAGPGDARLDLSQLDSMDPEGIHVIGEIADALGPGNRLVLLFPTRPVRQALEASGILDLEQVTIAPSGPLDGLRIIDLDAASSSTPSDLPFIWLG
jgi:anti-anti-sigma factor